MASSWGGGKGLLSNQTRCWSSKDALAQFRKEELQRSETVIVRTSPEEVDAAISAGKRLPPYKAHKRKAKDVLEHLTARTSASPHDLKQYYAAPDPLISREEDDDDGRIANTAANRVRQRCDMLRTNKEAWIKLEGRIRKAKKERIRSMNEGCAGRNIVAENRWLCDSKQECVEHWKMVELIKQGLAQAQTEEQKQKLSALWPRPPSPTHTAEAQRAKVRARSSRNAQRARDAAERREAIAAARQEKAHFIVHKEEVLAQRKKHAARVAQSQCRYLEMVALACRVMKWRQHLEHARVVRSREQANRSSVSIIQRNWLRTKAQEKGRKYRSAVVKIRRYVATFTRRMLKKQRAADLLLKFLKQFSDADFLKVMRTYRYNVLHCQRYWRSFALISKARLKVLVIMWDKVEKAKRKREKARAIAEVKKASKAAVDGGLSKVASIRRSNQLELERRGSSYFELEGHGGLAAKGVSASSGSGAGAGASFSRKGSMVPAHMSQGQLARRGSSSRFSARPSSSSSTSSTTKRTIPSRLSRTNTTMLLGGESIIHGGLLGPGGRKRDALGGGGLQRRMSTMSGVGLQRFDSRAQVNTSVTATALAAAAEMGIHIHRKVPRHIKLELLEKALHEKRVKFKKEWQRRRRERLVEKRASHVISVDDMRSLIRAEDSASLLLSKLNITQTAVTTGELFLLYSRTSEKELDRLIEKGREIADAAVLQSIDDIDATPVLEQESPHSPSRRVGGGSNVFLTQPPTL